MNRALLDKLAWKVLSGLGEAWCEVLRSKNRIMIKDGAHLKRRQSLSQVWSGVVWGSAILCMGLKWMVRIGRAASFWKDRWLREVPLGDMVHSQVGEEESELNIDHVWEQNVG